MGIRLDITNDMAKVEEVKILDKLTKCFVENPDNYLASLFTAEFLGWVQNRIRDDFPVDVMEYVNDYSKDEKIKELRQGLKSQEKVSELNAEEMNKLEGELKIAKDRIDFLNEELEMRTRELEKANKDCWNAGDIRLSLEDENTHLKAHLYDLEHPTK